MSPPRRRSAPLAILVVVLAIAAIGLAAMLVLVVRASGGQDSASPPAVAALRTEVAGQRALAAVRGTEIVQQQHRIDLLQNALAARQTPVSPVNGPRSYLASFQIDKYSYVLYIEWVESNGFVRNGRLLTTDNYGHKGSKTLQLSGIDNSGSFGFTARDQGATITFTGKANNDGTFTVTGLPWYVFNGFVGGTFTQTLHAGSVQDYNTAVANLAGPPS